MFSKALLRARLVLGGLLASLIVIGGICFDGAWPSSFQAHAPDAARVAHQDIQPPVEDESQCHVDQSAIAFDTRNTRNESLQKSIPQAIFPSASASLENLHQPTYLRTAPIAHVLALTRHREIRTVIFRS